MASPSLSCRLALGGLAVGVQKQGANGVLVIILLCCFNRRMKKRRERSANCADKNPLYADTSYYEEGNNYIKDRNAYYN